MKDCWAEKPTERPNISAIIRELKETVKGR